MLTNPGREQVIQLRQDEWRKDARTTGVREGLSCLQMSVLTGVDRGP